MKRSGSTFNRVLQNKRDLAYLKSIYRKRAYKQIKHKRNQKNDLWCGVSNSAVTTRTTEFLRKLYDENEYKKVTFNKNRSLRLPKNFCFIRHPEESIRAIYFSFMHSIDSECRCIRFDHRRVKEYNLTSEVLLGLAVESGKQYRRQNRNKKIYKGGQLKKSKYRLRVKGDFPSDENHHQLISEIGIIKEVTGDGEIPTPPLSKKEQHLFVKKNAGSALASVYSDDQKTKTSEKFADYVSECIGDHSTSLEQDELDYLMNTVSEVLCNAERHSNVDGKSHIWHARGYLNSSSKDAFFEVSLFNFGMTMADTFERLPSDHYSKELVMEYVDAHKGTFDRERLLTVAALQHRYSCKNKSSSGTNGQGTVVLIEFFESLCKKLSEKFGRANEIKPLMSIVSGKTHILFDGTYQLCDIQSYSDVSGDNHDEQFIIAFNSQNSLKYAPDSKYVRKMDKAYFPGVAISIRFPLKEGGVK